MDIQRILLFATITKRNDHTKGIDSWIRGKGMKSLLVGLIHHLNESKIWQVVALAFLISTSSKTPTWWSQILPSNWFNRTLKRSWEKSERTQLLLFFCWVTTLGESEGDLSVRRVRAGGISGTCDWSPEKSPLCCNVKSCLAESSSSEKICHGALAYEIYSWLTLNWISHSESLSKVIDWRYLSADLLQLIFWRRSLPHRKFKYNYWTLLQTAEFMAMMLR